MRLKVPVSGPLGTVGFRNGLLWAEEGGGFGEGVQFADVEEAEGGGEGGVDGVGGAGGKVEVHDGEAVAEAKAVEGVEDALGHVVDAAEGEHSVIGGVDGAAGAAHFGDFVVGHVVGFNRDDVTADLDDAIVDFFHDGSFRRGPPGASPMLL